MSRRDAADEDDIPVAGQVIVCRHHPEMTYLFWQQCPRCQGEANLRRADDTRAELARFRSAIEQGDDEAQRQSIKQLRGLGVGVEAIQAFASAVSTRMAATPARPRARREDF